MENKILNKIKKEILKKNRQLNPHPDRVKDPLFLENKFFDPYDLLQVKYEMLRQVEKDGVSITNASKTFGFSRLLFYRTKSNFEKNALGGLIPQKRGPKEARKLKNEIMKFIEGEIKKDKNLSTRKLQELLKEKFNLIIHIRSIERAIVGLKKKRVKIRSRK